MTVMDAATTKDIDFPISIFKYTELCPVINLFRALKIAFLMFHVTYRDNPPVACRISETPEAIDTN